MNFLSLVCAKFPIFVIQIFQVGDTIWGKLSDSEDHIVPYPKGAEESTLLNFGDYNKKHKSEDASIVLKSTEQTAGAKNDFSRCNPGNDSTFKTNEELSDLRLDMDLWPDLPFLSAALGKGYNDENQDTFTAELMNNFDGSTNLNKARGNMGYFFILVAFLITIICFL